MPIICRLDYLCICLHTAMFLLIITYFLSIRSVTQLQRQLALGAYPKWYCVKPGVVVLARRIRSVLNRCWNFWWIFDFPDDNQLSIGTLIVMLTPMTKIRTLLPSSSNLFHFDNPFPSLKCLEFCIKKCYLGCSPCSPKHKFYLLRFQLTELYTTFWQPYFVLQPIILNSH